MKFPSGFIDSIKTACCFDEYSFTKAHETDSNITSVRINPFKYTHQFDSNEKVKWCESGRYLEQRPVFTNDPLLHAGSYYVQEASSMFIAHLVKNTVRLSEPIKALDLCAAPGGKTTLLASLISSNSILVANEAIKSRSNILAENITKWGNSNVIVSNNDPKQFAAFQNHFDLILVDAPCSGSGLFRKDKNAINEWSKENVILCQQRQQRILSDILPALKENGILIYSTCSYSYEENEFISDWLIDNFNVRNLEVNIDNSWGIVKSNSEKHNATGFRFYPDKLKGEGFYASCFVKTSAEKEKIVKSKINLTKINKNELYIIAPWVKNSSEMLFFKYNHHVYMIQAELESNLMEYLNCLYLKKSATRIGKIMGNDFIPDHELSLSIYASPDIQKTELSKQDALTYLKKQHFTIPNAKMGWQLITYQNQNLGWVKVLQNRVNNYYPTDWRILKDISE